MTDRCSSGRGRVVRARRLDSPAPLAEIDQHMLAVLCTHRVVTQAQLGRLFPGVPERTLRYRTRRLHDLGLAGRSRPYRDHGSAPNHHWPTRRADCLMRGEPAPRGGERSQPNPIFLAHAAALTGLYVTLTTEASTAGLVVQEYRREGQAREPFTNVGKERALAPDAMVILNDSAGRKFGAFVEIDLGTMSHTRLRQKAELYAAYATSDAWHGRHLFLPALLFLTTTDTRAAKFLKALARALSLGPRSNSRRAFVAGAGGIAWAPHRLLASACLADLDGNIGLTLLDVLNAARAPYQQQLARRGERDEAEKARRRVLRDDPEAMREHLASYRYALGSYIQDLGPVGARAIELLIAQTDALSPDARAVLRAIARDLDLDDQALLEPQAHVLTSPSAGVLSEVALLTEHYRRGQAKEVEALAARDGEGPSLRRARKVLREGGLLDSITVAQLSRDAERDSDGRREQHARHVAYLEWREQAARRLARQAGPLGRLTHRAEAFYAQLDRERLCFCTRCEEPVYPPEDNVSSYGSPADMSCHYCRASNATKPYDPAATIAKESEAYP
jgi:hypothetical protein